MMQEKRDSEAVAPPEKSYMFGDKDERWSSSITQYKPPTIANLQRVIDRIAGPPPMEPDDLIVVPSHGRCRA